ncbi:hypothetical protein B296_00040778 [Ensete ventricosum]|uniref:Uncharacterized protein n=1 Tax=Ensete ventricosum TaxID=4639 RepID=A0A426Z2Q1_ENSVE|nr:hypothetical protein B296_00040778 [Ensete ventricosum]
MRSRSRDDGCLRREEGMRRDEEGGRLPVARMRRVGPPTTRWIPGNRMLRVVGISEKERGCRPPNMIFVPHLGSFPRMTRGMDASQGDPTSLGGQPKKRCGAGRGRGGNEKRAARTGFGRRLRKTISDRHHTPHTAAGGQGVHRRRGGGRRCVCRGGWWWTKGGGLAGAGRLGSYPASRRRRLGAKVMSWWRRKVVFPVRRAWLVVSSRVKSRKHGNHHHLSLSLSITVFLQLYCYMILILLLLLSNYTFLKILFSNPTSNPSDDPAPPPPADSFPDQLEVPRTAEYPYTDPASTTFWDMPVSHRELLLHRHES